MMVCFELNFSVSRSGRNNFNMMGNNDYNNQTSSNYNYYGLSASFLESLGITGPLHNKVFVANVSIVFKIVYQLRKTKKINLLKSNFTYPFYTNIIFYKYFMLLYKPLCCS